MTSETIEKGNIRSGYKKLTPLLFDKILEEWDGDLPEERDWWKIYSGFAVYFLERMSHFSDKLDITEENYDSFLPIMKDYFLTDKEYEIIVRNVAFMRRDTVTAYKETPMYKIYNMMKLWNMKPTITELLEMSYKNFMKLYLYTLGERFILPKKLDEISKQKGEYFR